MTRRSGPISSYIGDERGAFAVYAGIAFPLLIAILGFGLDYWSTLSMRARLDAAADAAAIAGVTAANTYVQTYGTILSGQALITAAEAAGTTAATQSFNANAGPTLSEVSAPPTVTPSFTQSTRTFTYTVSYNTNRATSFASIVGVKQLGLGGSATASQKELTYINVYVLVDTSQSMGIATNQTAMNQLYTASAPANPDDDYGSNPSNGKVGCVFGCHVAQPWGGTPAAYTNVSMEQIAHNNGIQLRIDTARQAIYQMVQSAQAQAVNNNISFAVYAMQDNPNTGTELTEVYPLVGTSNNYSNLLTAFNPTNYSVLDLGSNNTGGTGDSNQTASLSQFAASMPTQGDGSSALTPVNYVYVVTDGAIDVPGGCTDGHCTSAIPSTACSAIKSAGVTVGVIYTTYINIYAKNNAANGLDNRFSPLIEPFLGQIPGNLQTCSSGSGWYYQASDDASLLTAMQNLFQSTLSQARLTN